MHPPHPPLNRHCVLDTGRCIFEILPTPSRVVAYNIAEVQITHCIASSLKDLWYGSIEWKKKQNLSMKWRIFSVE